MKSSLRYLKLWQKKRSDLQINDDTQKDWLEMQSVLDQYMPVAIPAEDDKPSRSKGFKLLSLIFVSMSAAAMTCFFTYKIATKNNSHTAHNHRLKKHVELNIGSSSKDSVEDSLTIKSIALAKNDDSVSLTKQAGAIQNESIIGTVLNNKPENTSSNSFSDTSGFFSGFGQSAPGKKNNFLFLKVQNNSNQPVNTYYTNRNNLTLVSSVNSNTIQVNPSGIGKNGSSSSAFNSSSSAFANTGILQTVNLKRAERHRLIRSRNEHSLGAKIDNNQNEYPILFSSAPGIIFNSAENSFQIAGKPVLDLKIIQNQVANKSQDNKKTNSKEKNTKTKSPASKNLTSSNIDWGLLTGVNTSGSFTPKNQNSNFYGSSPVDLFFGLSATYNMNDKWAVNSQIRLFSPQTITTNYSHANGSKIDSGQLLQITSSRKIYSVSIPLHAVYKVNSNLSFLAGPVINLPVKQLNANSTLQPVAIRSDTTYYPKVLAILNGTKYEQNLNFGLSGGVSIHFKRLSFGAMYMKSLSGYQVSSDYGNYKSNNGTFQFTVGFQLNKVKP